MSIRAIVVDDDKDTVKVFTDYLKIKGIDIVGTGSDGKEAFELYQNLKPDIVILDMKMPQYSGKYAIDKIKKEDPNAKIIVVTGYHDYELAEDEVTAIFYKPYEIDEIMTVIKKIRTTEQKELLTK